MIATYLVALFGGAIALICQKTGVEDLAHINMFSGGIFLAAGFMHLLPDAVHNPALAKYQDQYHWPFAYMLCCIGYFSLPALLLCNFVWTHDRSALHEQSPVSCWILSHVDGNDIDRRQSFVVVDV